jgi:hypothetical protein
MAMGVEVPHELRGLWRREVITAPGFRDETTQVVWLQTGSWYADLRVPADRPSRPGADGFAAFGDDDLIACAKVQGFAGQLTVADGVCYWRRDLDYQPPSASPDEGRYSLDGDVMIEDGIHADYQEIWRRAPESTEPAGVFTREAEDGRAGLLVIGGRFLIEVVSRSGPASQAASLAEAVEAALAARDRKAAEVLLMTRIRFAERDQGGQWTTVLSSLPWLQGKPTWTPGAVRFDPDAGVLTTAFAAEPDRWRLIDAAASPGELLGWLGALEGSALGMTS